MGNSRTLDTRTWWKYNSVMIWVFSLAIFIIMLFTSYDYTKPFPNLASFTTTQIILLGLIVVLLLYRDIHKIKFGDFEIEFKDLEKRLQNAKRLMSNVQGIAPNPSLDEAKSEIDQAIGISNTIKSILRD